MKKASPLLVFICVFAVLMSLAFEAKIGGLEGADDSIESRISQVNEEYTPWLESIWVPSSDDAEFMIFSLQAALGAGFIGYYIWRKRNVQVNNSTGKKQ